MRLRRSKESLTPNPSPIERGVAPSFIFNLSKQKTIHEFAITE
jgi:hypothetical protein